MISYKWNQKMADWYSVFGYLRCSRPEVFCKKVAPKKFVKFVKFTRNYLCWIHFFSKVAGFRDSEK